jgi:two-component system, OmpR family, sensor histidine kinase ChvG
LRRSRAIANRPVQRPRFRLARHGLGSLKFKLLALIGIFIALPFVIYWQLEEVDHKMRDLVTRSIEQQNRLIAQALTPSLDALKTVPGDSLNPLLATYAANGTLLRLLVRPRLASQFFYVAAVPSQNATQLAETFDELEKNGISPQLDRVCGFNAADQKRYARESSREELLTSVIPIQTPLGCWVLIASHSADEFLDTSIGRSYADVPAVRVAAAIYLALAALSSLIAFNLWRNIRSFRNAAREVREGRGRDRPFASRSIAPEFAGVAADFDSLVDDLRTTARDIRQAAEDNAHSLKAPLATIEAASESLKRRLAPAEPRVARTIELMGNSIERLKALIAAIERYGYVTADLIDTPRTSIDLTEVVGEVLLRYQDVVTEQGLRLKRRLINHVFVRASKSMLEIVVENIVDNAISFSPPHGTIEVTLACRGPVVELRVDDEGPGVDPAQIERIFERYFSLRDRQPTDNDIDCEESHSGLGLWMVRRNVEAFGGTAFALNRAAGGLSVCATFPVDRLL